MSVPRILSAQLPSLEPPACGAFLNEEQSVGCVRHPRGVLTDTDWQGSAVKEVVWTLAFEHMNDNVKHLRGFQDTLWSDFDGDGHLDIIVCGNGNTDGLESGSGGLFLNDPSKLRCGELFCPAQNALSWAALSACTHISIGDIDNDGDMDVLLGKNFGGSYLGENWTLSSLLSLYINNGNGNFTAFTDSPVTSNETSQQRWVETLSGHAYFQQAVFVSSMAFGDIDGDGDLDLAVGYTAASGFETAAKLFINDGGGNFTQVDGSLFNDAGLPGGDIDLGLSRIVFGDIDGDGDLDIVTGFDLPTAFKEAPHVHIHRNDGSGNFTRSPLSFSNGREATVLLLVRSKQLDPLPMRPCLQLESTPARVHLI